MKHRIGAWITVDGIDGSGKTTAVQYLQTLYEKAGYTVHVIRGMGSGELGEFVRSQLLQSKLTDTTAAAACMLALLDCYDQIDAALQQGHIVISDRFIATYYAYNVTANKEPKALELFDLMLSSSDIIRRTPDLHILIDTFPVIAKMRSEARGEMTVIDSKPIEYFNALTTGYYRYFDKYKPEDSYTIITNNGRVEAFYKKLKDAILN